MCRMHGRGVTILVGYFLCSVSLVSNTDCPSCLNEDCNTLGECEKGCVPGYVGNSCTQKCPTHCKSSVCHVDRLTGTSTCNGCIEGFCGTQCKRRCPKECVTCDQHTCTICNVTICSDGFFGNDCKGRCNPNFGICDKETGKCIKCKNQFFGDNCAKQCPACLTRHDDSLYACEPGCAICGYHEIAKTVVPVAVAVAVAVGVAVACVVGVGLLVFVVKRKGKRKRRKPCSKGNADEILRPLSEGLKSDGLAQCERDRIKDLRGLKSDGVTFSLYKQNVKSPPSNKENKIL